VPVFLRGELWRFRLRQSLTGSDAEHGNPSRAIRQSFAPFLPSIGFFRQSGGPTVGAYPFAGFVEIERPRGRCYPARSDG